jgi:uncharacterized lipoprotein NlpE involved in copper resistance
MIKKAIIIGLLLIIAGLLVGCNKRFESIELVECNEGKYSVPEYVQKHAKVSGVEIKYIEIVDLESECVASAILKEPMIMMGTEVKQIPFRTCRKYCMEEFGDNDPDNIVSNCCYTE